MRSLKECLNIYIFFIFHYVFTYSRIRMHFTIFFITFLIACYLLFILIDFYSFIMIWFVIEYCDDVAMLNSKSRFLKFNEPRNSKTQNTQQRGENQFRLSVIHSFSRSGQIKLVWSVPRALYMANF